MKIKPYLKENGMDTSNIEELKKWATVTVVFINSNDGYFDETQFDVEINSLTKCKELEELFETFCKENKLDCDNVENVIIIRTANSYEELMQLEAAEEGYRFIEEM